VDIVRIYGNVLSDGEIATLVAQGDPQSGDGSGSSGGKSLILLPEFETAQKESICIFKH
jgi:hypothetical protein